MGRFATGQGGHRMKIAGGPAFVYKVVTMWPGGTRGGPTIHFPRYQVVRHWSGSAVTLISGVNTVVIQRIFQRSQVVPAYSFQVEIRRPGATSDGRRAGMAFSGGHPAIGFGFIDACIHDLCD